MHRIALLGIAFGLALSACAGAPRTTDEGPNPEHSAYGLYLDMCAECHGVKADGHGPEAPNLTPPPTDLTRLQGPGGRAIRPEDLIPVIDGRPTFRAHGDGDMPVWGWVLVPEESDADVRERTREELVRSLADYLVSIQQPPQAR